MERLTVKDIKAQALSIKSSGAKGAKAWDRLELYCKDFSNVDFNNGHMVIFVRDSYKLLCGQIIKSDFFFL